LEADDGKLVRYRCRVGHYFNADALLDSKTDALETALWSAINVMEERAELSERLASRAQATGYSRTSHRYAETSADMRRQVEQLRSWLAAPGPGFRIEPADDPQTVGEAPAADS
jgi:two-component system chemotaxis response regulator CheB